MNVQKRSDGEIIGEYAALALAYVYQGQIVRVNKAFEELFAFGRAEVVGRRWEDFRQDVFAGEMDICAEGVSHCLRMHNSAGHRFWASLQGKALDEDDPDQGVVWTIQDVTAQKQAADALQRAKLAADKATRAKGEFLANMSHEIRTPMNVIIGMTGLVLDHEIAAQQRSYLQSVQESANSLLALLNDILDYSKVESGCLQLEQKHFDFKGLVEGVVGTFQHVAEAKGISLRSVIDVQTRQKPEGDVLRLRQILVNLVNNALKFTSDGGVTVEACLADQGKEGLQATFRVHDTGIGIAAENRELIFTSFAQADSSTSRKYGGSGLGLAICRQLVELMQGSLTLQSELGVGSVFTMTVNLARQSGCVAEVGCGSAGRQQSGFDYGGEPMTILVADDHLANQQLAKALLEKAGHRVWLAANGLEVLELLAEANFDHILMDVQMPVLDGLATTHLIRKLERGEVIAMPGLAQAGHDALRRRLVGGHVHIVAVTANALAAEKEHCLAAGLDNYLTKPYDQDSLLAVVANRQQKMASPPAAGCQGAGLGKVSRFQVWQHVAKAFGLDNATTDLVVATYGRSLAENLSGLRKALAGGDFLQMRQQAHAIRGAFLNLGLGEFAQAALDIENRAGQQDDERFGEIVAAMQEGLHGFLEDKGAVPGPR